MHCIEAHRAYRPMWCKDAFPIIGVYQYFALLDIWHMEYFKTFSVYKYVQKEHWNVGLFRYYQRKQIPNFLLAFPILFLGMCAVLSWIGQSWKLFVKNEKVSPQATEKWWCKLCRIIQWADFAVRASGEEPETLMKNLKEREQPSVLLFGPILLPYYVVLGAACVVGATIAHVQITTRFIFASCPAIYWYMAYIYISNDRRKSRSLFARLLLSRSSILCYCGGFILAGVVMHPNWLPWT
jgi:phosphatidylinositol glycan class V